MAFDVSMPLAGPMGLTWSGTMPGYSGELGWGSLNGGIPTAAGEVARGSVPRYFTEPPKGVGALSPLAQAYLSRMFPQWLWGEETSPYTITPYAAEQPAVLAGGEPGGEVVKAAVPEAPEVMGETEKVSPKVPSAQLYQRLQSQGAVPNLRQYVEDILEIPWESYIGTIQAYWPSEQKRRSPTWRTTRQL